MRKVRHFLFLQEWSSNLHKYSSSRTDDNKVNSLICDVMQDLMSLQEISHNIQDYSHNGTTPAFQMKWLLCDVICSHHWSERQEILSCCRKNRVFDGGIHQRRLLLGKMKWFICDVIADYHLIAQKRNMIINPRELIFPSKWSESCVMWYLYIADEKSETFNPVAGVIHYLMEVFTKHQCW